MSEGKKKLLTLIKNAEIQIKHWRSQTINMLAEMDELVEIIESERNKQQPRIPIEDCK